MSQDVVPVSPESAQQMRVVVVGQERLHQVGDPLLRADDYGLTRGDGCFDATMVRREADGGHVVHDFEPHLARLGRSAAALDLTVPEPEAWCRAFNLLLDGWTQPDAILKFLLTRGNETEPGTGPTALLTLVATDQATLSQRSGLRVVTLDRGTRSDAFNNAPWLLGGAKTLSYAVNMAAKREAARRGAQDALFTSTDGYALEAPTAGLVWLADGVLGTTPLGGTGVLASITVAAAETGAKANGQPWRRELLPVTQLHECDGLWLLSSVRGAAPIVELDGAAVRQDADMTQALREWTGFGWMNSQ